ncbi:MAG: hypothetical protein AAGG01_10795 [Planctomycetota bacterium]
MKTLKIQTLDVMSRMFLATIALTEADLDGLGVQLRGCTCCLSKRAQLRGAAHALMAESECFARAVTDLLDLRYASDVMQARSSSIRELAGVSRHRGQKESGPSLVGWAWALMTDERKEAASLGHNFMGECYVRAIGALALPAAGMNSPGVPSAADD